MSEIFKNILQIKKSKPYIEYNKYHRGNILGITKMSRRELMHSNFIAWALDPEATHRLGFYPIYQFIRSLSIIQNNADNTDARKIDLSLIYSFFSEDFIKKVDIEREFAITVGTAKNYIDLLIEVTTKEKILPIIIENKVESKENGKSQDQTVVYYDWCENKYADTSKYYAPIYVYLYPEYKTNMQKSKEYIRMTYQNLVDYILEPSMETCGDYLSISNYKTYLQCLSFQADNDKGEHTMAISSEEKRILNDFVKENKDLLCAILNELQDEVNDASALTAITTTVKDYSTYHFEGNEYGKSRLVLAVVKKYVADRKPADFNELQNAFMPKLQGSMGVVKLIKDVSDKDKGIGGIKRYFVDASDIIALPSGEEAIVCTQWGKENIIKFIDHVNTILGYTISKS